MRKYCQSTEVLVQALESQLKNKYAAMPFPKYEHDLCNHLHMLLENLALWMQASHGSVWYVLCLLQLQAVCVGRHNLGGWGG